MPHATSSLPPQDEPSPENRPRVSRTGIMERSVAGAVISAARQRGLSRKPRSNQITSQHSPDSQPDIPSHHRRHGGGFVNPWDSAVKDSGGLRSRGASGSRTFFHKVSKDRRPPDEQLASLLLLATRPDFEDADNTLDKDKYAMASFWIGHCTFWIKVRGLTVLTDPVWSARLGPLGNRRLVPPACEIGDVPAVDVVLLSSACYDHFDKVAVGMLSDKVRVWLCPLGVRELIIAAGVDESRVVELDWWNEYFVGDCRIVCTPSQACSVRDDALWCSWVVNAPYHSFFFCGMTGYRAVLRDMIEDGDNFQYRHKFGGPSCPVFKEIGRRLGSMDTAFLPIGGFKPRAVMSAVQGDAMDMLFVHRDLKARRSVAHRWGTFAFNDEGLLDAIRCLENALLNSPIAEHEVSYVRHGQMHVT